MEKYYRDGHYTLYNNFDLTDSFMKKANAYYPKAESILLEYLQADKKLHSVYYMPKPWIISSQKLFPYLDYDITN